MSYLPTLKKALFTGGDIIRRGFYQKRRVKFKSPTSPVTHIDIMSEKAIIKIIKKKFPTHSVLGEESDYEKGQKTKGAPATQNNGEPGGENFRWIIDPLDGTVNFLHGFPQCSVTIGVEKEGRILAGGIFDPFRNELFLAERGRGATLNGKRIRVSRKKPLSRSLLLTGFPYDHREKAQYYLDVAKPFLKTCMDLRRLGSAALDLAWVACGRVEGYWEFNLNPWDMAAGWLIVEEAGGKVTDFLGKPIDINNPKQTLASNGLIHREMVRHLRRVI